MVTNHSTSKSPKSSLIFGSPKFRKKWFHHPWPLHQEWNTMYRFFLYKVPGKWRSMNWPVHLHSFFVFKVIDQWKNNLVKSYSLLITIKYAKIISGISFTFL
jgi:hypothetical protein